MVLLWMRPTASRAIAAPSGAANLPPAESVRACQGTSQLVPPSGAGTRAPARRPV
jgi:hypothetical protein